MRERRSVQIESLSAVTLTVSEIGRSVRFYETLGFERKPGDSVPGFASFALGGDQRTPPAYLNLLEAPHGPFGGWGRVIVYVSDVDAFYERLRAAGIAPAFAPSDAPWGERYFHVLDPDGHELSFAKPRG